MTRLSNGVPFVILRNVILKPVLSLPKGSAKDPPKDLFFLQRLRRIGPGGLDALV